MFHTILVASDLSENSEPALRQAIELARRVGARVVALHVTEPPYESRHWFTTLAAHESDLYRSIAHRERDEARASLEEAVTNARGDHREGFAPEVRVVSGIPADAILEEASRAEADLIVVGTHGRRGVAHALIGSIAERVVRTATVPVLAVRARGR